MSAMDYQAAYRGKTILITGGAGAIGSNLTKALGELGAKLGLVLDDLSSASRWNVPAWVTCPQ
jgi:UDP-glucose 4-epimerase